MVGHVQSRKAQAVVTHFDYIHSVDRLKIARRLSRFAQEVGQTLPVLLECNVSGEETKFGFGLQGWEQDEARREAFFAAIEDILALPGLSVRGLMTMAPLVTDPETVRPVFASLRALLDALRERFPIHDWRHLSMGMTDDFEVAIEEGATMVRIGRAIFGVRSD
jgi:pyridoxal phosphate enzyme (YggS family)